MEQQHSEGIGTAPEENNGDMSEVMPEEGKTRTSTKEIILVVVLVLLILASAVVGYLYWDKNARSSSPESGSGVPSPQGEEAEVDEQQAETDATDTAGNAEVGTEEGVPEGPVDAEASSCTFYLTEGSSPGSGEIFTRWVVEDCDTSYGYRVLRSTSGTPTYPADDYRDIDDSEAEFAVWTENVSGTYQVRMCLIADDSSCGEYTSNTLTVTVL